MLPLLLLENPAGSLFQVFQTCYLLRMTREYSQTLIWSEPLAQWCLVVSLRPTPPADCSNFPFFKVCLPSTFRARTLGLLYEDCTTYMCSSPSNCPPQPRRLSRQKVACCGLSQAQQSLFIVLVSIMSILERLLHSACCSWTCRFSQKLVRQLEKESKCYLPTPRNASHPISPRLILF